MKDNVCNEGIYVHLNRETLQWRVGESQAVSSRAPRSFIKNQSCLGTSEEVETIFFPTCGLPAAHRKELEVELIDLLSRLAPETRCNLIRR
jgi:hypothetical protein